MSYRITNQAKELLSKRLGISYGELLMMNDQKIEQIIYERTGRKIEWPKCAKVKKEEKDEECR